MSASITDPRSTQHIAPYPGRPPVRLVSILLITDMMFLTAIPPLLPFYARRFGFGVGTAGVLAGSYAAALLLTSLPAGLLIARIGVKRGVLIGVTLLGLSSLAFGLAPTVGLLVAARF